ncbi:HD family phosphohydrolase [Thermoanaerobacterium sp. DL9XJH110]|uniref:HD family phosphohydrolase n=1 Tax=Thermoanaerobacterium sp. DL9XJH110 TaxID=3386643 RepID=UPI003BB56CBC
MALNRSFQLQKFKLLHNSTVQRVALGLFFFFALTILIFASSIPQKYNIKVGDVAQENIVARKDAINTIATRKLQQAAADAVPKKYTLDHNITLEVKSDITHIFQTIREVRSRDYLDDREKVETLKKLISKDLSEETYLSAIKMDDTGLRELETITKAVMEKIMEDGVKEDAIDRAKTYIIEEFKSIKIPQEMKNIGEDIAFSVIRYNMVYDREATERQQQEAMNAVEPVKITKNQILIEKGTTITSEHMELLKELGLLAQDRVSNFSFMLGTMLLVGILEGILFFSIYFYHRKLAFNNMYLSLMALIILATLVISLGVKTISNYMIPLAAGSMLISILISPSVALISSFVMDIVIGVMLGNDFTHSLVAFLGAVTGVFCTVKVAQRSDLTKAGGIISAVNFVLIFALGLLNNNSLWDTMRQIPWGIINGILSSVLAIGTLPFLESVFGITTSIKLLELSNPNQPLLRKLMIDAPGTYHHSIIVGNLAQAAAEAVGADPLLARVGANYHDIGKLKRPYFFIENQLTADNPHDKLNPSLSSLIITSHVKDGVEIAREYRLPLSIQDFIAQHHGTTLLSYFYKKAGENSGENRLDEDGFRYDGPKPQTREVAIVMLADSVEAAVRSMSRPTPGKIDGLIRQIIKDKLADGQLDESDLTLKDLDRIAAAFSRVLTGIFHTRIEYPDKLKELERRGTKDA